MRANSLPNVNLERAAIADLLPTQVTIGMREVDIKRKRWREKNGEQAICFLNSHSVPVILGPGNRHYVLDRHHLIRALSDEGLTDLPIKVIADVSELSDKQFWIALENRGWTHPFDDEGRRYNYSDIPKSVSDLIDDPFRSLAGALKRGGGYLKDKSPFSEFHWADFLRTKIERKIVEMDFDHALSMAMNLAVSEDAMALPGWRGLHARTAISS